MVLEKTVFNCSFNEAKISLLNEPRAKDSLFSIIMRPNPKPQYLQYSLFLSLVNGIYIPHYRKTLLYSY
jgi:hypothetical protein